MAQVFTNQPQNVTVVEGRDAIFICTAEENGMALNADYGWQFIPSGSSSRVPVLNGTNLTGIEMVTFNDELGTTITFSRVQSEADGGAVVCLAVGSRVVESDPAFITVRREYGVGVTVATISASFLAVLFPHIVI